MLLPGLLHGILLLVPSLRVLYRIFHPADLSVIRAPFTPTSHKSLYNNLDSRTTKSRLL